MEDETLRRIFHMCAPLFALLYLLPEDLGPLSRNAAAVMAWAAFAAFEVIRIKKGIRVRGLRDYERGRPSAAFWMCTAFLPMLLFFPPDYAVPLLVGFGFVDPICGILRKRMPKAYPSVPLSLYFMIMATSLSVSYGATAGVFAVSLAVTVSAIAAEGMKNRIVDDDFLMLAVPLVVLWISGYFLL